MSKLLISLVFVGLGYSQPMLNVTFPDCYVGTTGKVSNTCKGIRFNDNASGNFAYGDTWHFALTSAGNRFGTFNDGFINSFTSFANVGIVKLAPYDVTNASGTGIVLWSDVTFGVAYTGSSFPNAPNCGGGGCSIKSYDPFTVQGCYFLPVFLQQGTFGSHSTIIRSCDIDSGTPHWTNPAHIGGTALLNGDPPVWNIASPGSDIMFPGVASTVQKLYSLMPINPANWQDNGTTCPIIPTSVGGDGAGTYLYFVAEGGGYGDLWGPFRVPCNKDLIQVPAQWEAYNGTSWTSTLSNAQSLMKLSPFYVNGGSTTGFPGTNNAAGTSPAITYLPDFQTFVLLGQVCLQCANGYYPDLIVSQSNSLLGGWKVGPWKTRWGGTPGNVSGPGPFQYGTNVRGNVLSGAIDGVVTSVTVTLSYNSALEPSVPFVMTVGTEDMLVTVASGTARTVTRGYNGTTAVPHSNGDGVISAYRLRPGLVQFLPGTYSYNSGIATIDLSVEGEGFNFGNTVSDTKANNVYGPYFFTLQIDRIPQTIGPIGSRSARFTTYGTRNTLPLKGIKMWWDMWDAAGATAGNSNSSLGSGGTSQVFLPKDQITGMYCIPASSQYASTNLGWSVTGLFISNSVDGVYSRCVSTSGWPINNDVFTITAIADFNTLTGNHTIAQIQHYGNTGGKGFWLSTFGAFLQMGWDNIHGVGPPSGAITTGIHQITITKTTGTSANTVSFFIDGVAKCGADSGVVCANGSMPTTIATDTTAALVFGLYGSVASGDCTVDGTACNWQNYFNSTILGFGLWDNAWDIRTVHNSYVAMKTIYARQGVILP